MKNITNLPNPNITTYNPHPQIQDYFKILSPEFPSWLYDYINTKEMLRQQLPAAPFILTFSNQTFSILT